MTPADFVVGEAVCLKNRQNKQRPSMYGVAYITQVRSRRCQVEVACYPPEPLFWVRHEYLLKIRGTAGIK